MIARITGRLAALDDEHATLDCDHVSYEVLVPASVLQQLADHAGEAVSLHTIQYLEGNPAGANLIPRLIGFLTPLERAFFRQFTRVKGISYRKALRAMALPIPQLASAIAQGDARLLTSLPEIGKKTATQIISDLRDQMEPFLDLAEAPAPPARLTDAQQTALEILVQWGDRRADAERWVAIVAEEDADLNEPEDIVRAAYRVKERRA